MYVHGFRSIASTYSPDTNTYTRPQTHSLYKKLSPIKKIHRTNYCQKYMRTEPSNKPVGTSGPSSNGTPYVSQTETKLRTSLTRAIVVCKAVVTNFGSLLKIDRTTCSKHNVQAKCAIKGTQWAKLRSKFRDQLLDNLASLQLHIPLLQSGASPGLYRP